MTEEDGGHMLTADEIWAADDIEEKIVDVPEWGGQVKIRALTLRQTGNVARQAIRNNPQTGQIETNRETLVLLTLQEGMIEPKLTPQEARRLSEKSARAVSTIVAAINALGPTPEAVDEADKSLWPESDAPVPIRASAGARDDVGASHNGNVHA